jgi:hypothetical protein
MTDRELLEAAAMACGWTYYPPGQIDVSRSDLDGWIDPKTGDVHWRDLWRPLTDDGDALRLACALRINVEHVETLKRTPHGVNCWPIGRGDCGRTETDIADYAAATRRAIVRAAAAIGAKA